MSAGLRDAASRPLSPWQTVKAVAWSFVGLRRGAGYREDMARLNPVHVAVVGVAGAVLFVLALVALVHWVIASGVAA